MYLNLIFIFILHKCIHQLVQGAASGVKIGLYSIQNDLKFKTLSSEILNTNSMMACAIFMQMSNSCAACYHDNTDISYITQTGCYDVGVTDPVLRWHVLRKSLWVTYLLMIISIWGLDLTLPLRKVWSYHRGNKRLVIEKVDNAIDKLKRTKGQTITCITIHIKLKIELREPY
jgi:hypothetical protein